ncbi:DNA-binding FrmR family transcriptional regulator [Frigoribacterium endophyticum]|nr:DNA-binding FrmR family transcriptional regulator [Frigoribacterium endophyticum]
MDAGGAVRDDEGRADPGAVPGPPEPTRDSSATGGPGYVGAGSKEQIVKRLRRAEGQVRGIQRMVEDDVYCIDVLTQVSAATKALETVALQLLEDHLAHCVAEAAREGGAVADQKIAEASAAIARLVRS